MPSFGLRNAEVAWGKADDIEGLPRPVALLSEQGDRGGPDVAVQGTRKADQGGRARG